MSGASLRSATSLSSSPEDLERLRSQREEFKAIRNFVIGTAESFRNMPRGAASGRFDSEVKAILAKRAGKAKHTAKPSGEEFVNAATQVAKQYGKVLNSPVSTRRRARKRVYPRPHIPSLLDHYYAADKLTSFDAFDEEFTLHMTTTARSGTPVTAEGCSPFKPDPKGSRGLKLELATKASQQRVAGQLVSTDVHNDPDNEGSEGELDDTITVSSPGGGISALRLFTPGRMLQTVQQAQPQTFEPGRHPASCLNSDIPTDWQMYVKFLDTRSLAARLQASAGRLESHSPPPVPATELFPAPGGDARRLASAPVSPAATSSPRQARRKRVHPPVSKSMSMDYIAFGGALAADGGSGKPLATPAWMPAVSLSVPGREVRPSGCVACSLHAALADTGKAPPLQTVAAPEAAAVGVGTGGEGRFAETAEQRPRPPRSNGTPFVREPLPRPQFPTAYSPVAAGNTGVYETYVSTGAGKFPFQSEDIAVYKAYARMEQRPRPQRDTQTASALASRMGTSPAPAHLQAGLPRGRKDTALLRGNG